MIKQSVNTSSFFRRLSIPTIALITAFCTGVIIWVVLDRVQTALLEELLDEEINTLVEQRARAALSRYQIIVSQYKTVTHLLAPHGWMRAYLDEESTLIPFEKGLVTNPRKLRWAWEELLKASTVPPTWLMLIDGSGTPRAVLTEDDDFAKIPYESLKFNDLYIEQASVSPQIVIIQNTAYLLLGQKVTDSLGEEAGTLLVVVSMQDVLGNSFLNGLSEGALFALLDDHHHILASSNSKILLPESKIEDYYDSYDIKIQSFSGFELSDTGELFVTLIPHHQLERISDKFVYFDQWQRFIASAVYIFIFLIIAYLFSAKLNRTLNQMSNSAYSALGIQPSVENSNNKLYLLEDWMQALVVTFRTMRNEMTHRHASQIQQSELLKSAISESSPDSIITIDEDMLIVDTNPAVKRVFDISTEEAINTPMVDLIAESSKQQFVHIIKDYLASTSASKVKQVDLYALSRGREFPIELTLVRITIEARSLFTLHLHDLSVRKLQEKQISDLAKFANESPEPILRINENGSVIYANESSEILLDSWGCSRGQKLPFYWINKINQSFEKLTSFEEVINTGVTHYSLLFVPISDSGYLNIYGRDITDKIKAEALTRQHQTELVHVCRLSTMGEMATGIAHELNQPLSAITNYSSGCVRRLESTTDYDQSIRDVIVKIGVQAQRASDIIRSMRAMAVNREDTRVEIDVNQMVEEVITFLSFELNRANVDVMIDSELDQVFIRGDLVQIEQVILNIVKNAIDALVEYQTNDPKLRISIEKDDSRVILVIADNGPGIADSIREELFNPFVSTKKDGKGMGMGLAISATIIQNHNGEISVDSKEGKGSIFTLHFQSLKKK